MSENLVTLKNGAVQDLQTGRFVKGAIQTSEQASALARRRHELARQAVVQGMLEGTETKRPRYAIAKVASVQAQIATTPDAGRAATLAANWLMERGGYAAPRAAAVQAVVQVNIVVQTPTADALSRLGDVIEGEYAEG